MKFFTLSSVLFCSVFYFCSTAIAQTSGGPDTYGYTWKNDAAPGGPVYSWKEISVIGTPVSGLADDNTVGPFTIGFNFHYYWSDYNQVWIGSNGYIAFQSGVNIAAAFPNIPTSGGNNNNFIAGMMSDLTAVTSASAPVPGAAVYFYTNNMDTFIVQWDSIPFWSASGPSYTGRNTFQLILSGSDSSITLQYKLQSGTTQGNDLKTGIENVTGVIGLPVLNNTYPTSGSSVKFYYPSIVTYQVTDVAPSWNTNPENGGFFIPKDGAPFSMTAQITNTGNQDVTSAFNVIGQILDSNFSPVLSDTVVLTNLGSGKDTVITFADAYTPGIAGTHVVRVRTKLASDMNAGNDSRDVEMFVADTTANQITLRYDAGAVTGQLNWTGGGGGGIYIEPPFYPATVNALSFYMITASLTDGFISSLRDDDGAGGTPGTLLASDTFPGGVFASDVYTTVGLTAPYTITSGGVYAGWESADDTMGLGTENLNPISNRSYEILGGTWAIYRNRSIEDMMIRVLIDGSAITGYPSAGRSIPSALFPNPAQTHTALTYTLEAPSPVEISVSDISGNKIASWNFHEDHSGNHCFIIPVKIFASGIYFFTLRTPEGSVTHTFVK